MRVLPDAGARERAESDLSRNYVVTAGAGTGKTTLLLDRALAALESGTPVDGLVAITFTEKAAGELKEKLRGRVERRALEDEANRPLWEEALRGLDRAPVSTIHSFAGSILREFPLQAGVDPGVRVVDALESGYLLRTAWNRFLRQELSGAVDGWLPILEAGDLESLRALALRAAENRDILLAGPDPGSLDGLHHSVRGLLDPLEEELRSLAPRCSRAGDAVGKRATAILGWLSGASGDVGRLVEILRAEARLPTKTPGGTPGSWDGDPSLLEHARAVVNETLALLGRLRDLPEKAAAHEATLLALGRLGPFLDLYEEEKRLAGALDFQDLLIRARDLLRDAPGVRATLKRRFRHILVDEFQDTDPLQAEIVLYLCEGGGEAREWREISLQSGKLFLVGDPKQAIYGWRRADMTVYREVRDMVVEQGGEEVFLQSNFRSAGPPVRLVNGLFGRLMEEEEEGRLQPPYVPIQRSRAADDPPGPLVHVLGVSAESLGLDKLNAAECAPAEAHALATLMKRARQTLEVMDRDGVPRPATYGDMALLARSNSRLRGFEQALQEEEVPCVVVGGKGFFTRPEVNDLLLLLGALVQPADGLSLAGALRSPLFAMTDSDLYRLRRAGWFDYRDEAPPSPLEEDASPDLGRRTGQAYALLRRWHRGARALRAADLLETILEESPLASASASEPDGEQRYANLQRLVELADLYAPPDDPTAAGFLAFLQDMGEDLPDEGESPLAEEGGDAVRLLTVHKAKGLEFPVVFLGALQAGAGGHEGAMLIERRRGGAPPRLGVRMGPWLTLAHEDGMQDWERRRRAAEDLRLLYVAATRARDHLFLSGGFTTGGGGSAFDEICGHLGLDPGAFPHGDGDGPLGGRPGDGAGLEVLLHSARALDPALAFRRRRVSEVQASPLPEPDLIEEALRSEAERLVEWEEAHREAADTPSRMDAEEASVRPFVEGPAGRRRALAVGSAVHHVLEHLAPGQTEGWEPHLEAFLRQLQELPAEEREAVRDRARGLLEPFLAGDLWRGMGEASRWWNEVDLALRHEDGRLVRGRADLLLERRDGTIEIVDWKTDALQGLSAAEAAAAHDHQARVYLEAVRRATGREARFTFVYLETGEAVPWDGHG